jgi:hypothetical protein
MDKGTDMKKLDRMATRVIYFYDDWREVVNMVFWCAVVAIVLHFLPARHAPRIDPVQHFTQWCVNNPVKCGPPHE